MKVWMLPLAVASMPVLATDLADQTAAPLGAATLNAGPVSAATESPNGTAQLLFELQQLRSEVQMLRGQVEEQAQLLNRLQKDGRDRYLDVDRRISALNADIAKLKEGKMGSGSSTQSSVVSVSSSSTGSASSSAPVPKVSGSAKEAYQDAYGLVKEKKFDQAIKAYQSFIKAYPDSTLLPNAYYWLGELYMVKNKTQDAEKVFTVVVEQYPQSRKTADASYKLGQIYSRHGNEDKARQQMQSVKEKYPNSTAAKLADRYLEKQAQ
jgi:tol-pal system protein YbgF